MNRYSGLFQGAVYLSVFFLGVTVTLGVLAATWFTGYGPGDRPGDRNVGRGADGEGEERPSGASVQATFGPEALAGEIALAAYAGDLQTLRRYASKGLKDHYRDPDIFDRNVAASLGAAPELPQPPGQATARVTGAAPINLFGPTVFYMVTVEDRDQERLLGVALKEAPANTPEQTVYCYLLVENDANNGQAGKPGDKDDDLWRDLVGVENTCSGNSDNGQDREEPLPQKPTPEKPDPDSLVRWEGHTAGSSLGDLQQHPSPKAIYRTPASGARSGGRS